MIPTTRSVCGKATTPHYPSYKGKEPGSRRCQDCRAAGAGGSYMDIQPRQEAGTCTKCGGAFEYLRITVRRKSCDPCRTKLRQEYGKRHAAKRTQRERKDQQLRSNYNITLVQYEAMLASQGGGCAICQGQSGDGRSLSVDHDHSCCPGKRCCGLCVRGLLCKNCNVALGLLRDDRALFMRASAYLESTLFAVSA